MEKKDKKKTLTISSNLKKKIDTSSISSDGKKSYSVEKKKPFKGNKNINRINQSFGQINNPEIKKKRESQPADRCIHLVRSLKLALFAPLSGQTFLQTAFKFMYRYGAFELKFIQETMVADQYSATFYSLITSFITY